MPEVTGIYETVVYADDVPRTVAFYRDAIGLREIDPPAKGSAAFRLPDSTLLLIFDPATSSEPGRFVPSHGAAGDGHLAFRVDALDPYADRLRSSGIEIERKITWPLGGRSVYVRDPAGNSVEFVEGEIWDE